MAVELFVNIITNRHLSRFTLSEVQTDFVPTQTIDDNRGISVVVAPKRRSYVVH